MLQTGAIQPSSIPLEPPAAGMEAFAAIRGRRAVRSYAEEAVDRRTIERLLDLAVEAPSAMGLEPWAFVVIEDRDRLARFSDEVKKELARGGEEPSQELADMLRDPSFNISYGAPALVIVCATSPKRQAAEDCCLAAQNFMLAAHAEGLATCPIGLARGWLGRPEIKRRLGIPGEYVPVFPMILGHPGQRPASHGRLAPAVMWR
ncbi:MAG TPA: nitroreductase [Thermoanaerobaculia bacterium]|nr:nitroreductase [Thermoanaerobaculia bacterium]